MLRIALLGEQSIADATTGADRTRSARTLALVAFLVVHAGAAQPRQRIAGLFWPESTDAQALTNLRRELHSLRNALAGEPALRVTPRDLCWSDGGGVQVDLRTFDVEYAAARGAEAAGHDDRAARHADAALAAYRGDLLPGVDDDWVLEARTECQDRAVRLCALVGAARARLGAPADALDAARLRIRLRPLEEAGYRELMRLQAALGDRAAALGTYHRCASVLERELGVEPDEATRAVLRRLRATPSSTRAVPAVGSGTVAFVGRVREREALHAAWRQATSGRPAVALVRGGAGVGKSRLVAEAAGDARRGGAVTAVARCFASSGRLALAPVAEWLRSPEMQAAVARLDPVWRAEVHRLVPATDDDGAPAAGSLALVDAWQRHRFFEGLARALLGVGQPTLLLLDDVQWCDEETLTFLGFCLGLVKDARVLLVATLRDTESDGPAAAWIARMRAAGPFTDVALGPLAGPETARLAEAMRGGALSAVDRDLLAAVTGGFPLHVVEAMRAVGRGQLPSGDLAEVLGRRLGQASPAARELAALAAAVGRDVSLDLLVAAGELDADGVVAAVDELWRLRILREQGVGYDFSHDLLRDAAYAQVTPARRWLLHRRVAQGLEELHADDLGPVAAQLAEQYARGGRPERALACYRMAAAFAAGVFAHAEALRAYDGALEIVRARPPGRDRDAEELAVLVAMAAPLNARCGYADTELQKILERSAELAQTLGRRETLVDGLVGLWASRLVQGRIVDSQEVAQRMLALVDRADEKAGTAYFSCAGSAVFLGRPAQAVTLFITAAEITPGTMVSVGTRTDVHGTGWLAHAHWLCGDDAAAVAAAMDAVALARAVDHPYSLAVGLAYAAITRQLLGERALVERAVAELHELCERYGFGYYRDWAAVLGGWCRGGPDGIAAARRGIANLVADGALLRRPYWLTLLAELLDAAGDRDGARATLDDAAADAGARVELWWLPEVLRRQAAYDDPDHVATRLRAAADLAGEQGAVAILRRCERDLAARGLGGVRPPS